MLRHRLIEEVHQYVHHLDRHAHLDHNIGIPTPDASLSGLGSWAPRSQMEYQHLFMRFQELKHRFDGKHHLEHIMIESGIARDELQKVVKLFGGDLVESLCPWFAPD